MAFKKNWKDLTTNSIACELKSRELQNSCQKHFYTSHDPFGGYHTPLGTVYGVPADFSMWMPGFAFIASYLTAKKNL